MSKARNIGLDNANGTYITFIDADDYVDNDHVEKLMEYCCDEIDIVISGAEDFNEDGTIISKNGPRTITEPRIINVDDKYSFSARYHRTVVWGVLYKRTIIGKLRFDTSLYLSEDSHFFAMVLHNTSKICIIPNETYKYVHYRNSASHGVFDIKKYSELDAWEKIVTIFNDKAEIKKSCTYEYIKRCIHMYLSVYNTNGIKGKEKILKEISHRCRLYIKSGYVAYPSHKDQIRIILFKYAPKLFVFVNKLLGILKN